MTGLALGFLACPRRFNVAISRARALNVVVGHPVALTHWPHWHSLLQHCYSRGAFLGSGSEFIPRLGGGRENVDPALDSVVGDVEPATRPTRGTEAGGGQDGGDELVGGRETCGRTTAT